MLISRLVQTLWSSLSDRLPARRTVTNNGYAGPDIHVVSATRLSKKAFWETSLLGVSLSRASFNIPIRHTVAYENRTGLPAVYNAALDAMEPGEIAVFVHDDVVLYDFFLPHRIEDGLRRFDVIGPVGNALPAADHCSWYLRLPVGQDTILVIKENEVPNGVSGAINHLYPTQERFSNFGPAPERVALLDGLFLAARVSTLRRRKIRFDEQFDFHFYDLDFCRTCVSRGLKIGTWPMALGHASNGDFHSPAWVAAIGKYRAKWGVTAPGI